MNTLCRFVNKLFRAAIGSQRNSTLISDKKWFEEGTAVEKYVQNVMILLLWLTWWNYSFNGPWSCKIQLINGTKQCFWIYLAYMFKYKTQRICKMFFLSGRNLSCSCKWLLMILSFLSMNTTMTNPFVTLMQVKLLRFINATFSTSSHSKRIICIQTIFSKYGHNFSQSRM